MLRFSMRWRPAAAGLFLVFLAELIRNKVTVAPAPPPSSLPAATQTPPAAPTRPAMSEEERSTRNEQMIGELESQKKSLGLKVMTKGGQAGVTEELSSRAAPATPIVKTSVPALLKPASSVSGAIGETAAMPAGNARPAPNAALVLADSDSLLHSWVLLGFNGNPPAVDFVNSRLVLIKPSATKIISVTPGPKSIEVVYRSLLPGESPDPSHDRAAMLPLTPKAVLIYDASSFGGNP